MVTRIVRARIVSTWVVAVSAAFGSLGARAADLYPFPHYRLPSDPIAFDVGDFDADGDVDAAVLLNAPATVARFTNLGDGTFAAPVFLSLGTSAAMQRLGCGDFDGDGDLDLVAVGGGLRVTLAGQGALGFAAPQSVAIAIVTFRDSAVADVDGDGRADFVTVWNQNPANTMEVTFGAANAGLFGTTTSKPLFADARSVAVGDVTGDGIADVVTSARKSLHPFGKLDVFAFAPVFMQHTSGTNFDGIDLALADFDQDGKLDLVNGSSGTLLDVMQGKGVFVTGQPAFGPSLYLAKSGHVLAVGDFDDDGTPDLASQLLAVSFPNNATMNVFTTTGPIPLQNVSSVAHAVNGIDLRAADVDGDGDDDLLSIHTGIRTLHVVTSAGASVGPKETPIPAGDLRRLMTCDLGSDGRPDAIALSYTGGFVTLETGIDGSLGAPVTQSLAPLPDVRGGAIGDFNADGLVDLFASGNTVSTSVVRFGVADGSFTPAVSFPTSGQSALPLVGDLDLDGDLDVVDVAIGGASVKRGNGAGAFVAEPVFFHGPSAEQRDATLADVDLDGVLDLAYSGGTSHHYGVARGTGGGAGSAPFHAASVLAAIVPAVPNAAADTAGVDVVDVDGDGLPDVVGSQTNYVFGLGGKLGHALVWYRGLGGGAFVDGGSTAIVTGDVGSQTTQLELADVDADGRADAIVSWPSVSGVAVLRGTASGFDLATFVTLGANTWRTAVADLDLDGCPDLVADGGASVVASLHRAQATTTPRIDAIVPSTCPAVGGVVTIVGSGFSNVTQLAIGATTIGVSEFTVVDTERIEVAVPIPAALGLVNVNVAAAGGTSNGMPLTFVATDPPRLVVSPAISSAANLRLEWGHLPGRLPFLVANATGATFAFGGSTLLDPVVFLPLLALDAVGAGSATMPAAIVPSLVPIHVQFWTVAAPGTDPNTLAASPARTFTIVP